MEESSEQPSSEFLLANRYRCLRAIGSGASGTVYVAEDTLLDSSLVALKVYHPHVLASASRQQELINEVRLAQTVSHPSVVRTHELIRFRTALGFEQLAIAMEFVEGCSLQQVIEERRLPMREALQILSELANAIQAAHDKGIRHGDIKPGNILLSTEGKVKLADFGSASLADQQRLTELRTLHGTIQYCAPEQLAGECTDVRSDIYAFGVVMEELLSGRRSTSALPFATRRTFGIKRSVSPVLREVIRSCTADLDDRFQSISQVEDALRHSASSKKRAVSISRLLITGIVTVCAMVIALRIVALSSSETRTWLSYEIHRRTAHPDIITAASALFEVKHSPRGLINELIDQQSTEVLATLLASREDSTLMLRFSGDAKLIKQVFNYRNFDLALLLARHGASIEPDAVDGKGISLMEHALALGSSDWIRLFASNWDASKIGVTGIPALHMAIRVKQPKTIRLLLERGGDPYALHHDMTALHSAAMSTGPVLTEFLRLSLDPDVRDEYGRSPLVAAIVNRRAINVLQLIDYGATLDGIDCFGMPLGHHLAVSDSHTVDALLQGRGPEVLKQRDASGDTALHAAAVFGSSAVVERLLYHGASRVAQ